MLDAPAISARLQYLITLRHRLRLERVRLRSRESVQVHARRQGHHASAEEGSRMAKGHLKRIASVDCRAGPVGLLG